MQKLIAASLSVLSLSACSLVTVNPLLQAAGLVGSAASTVASMVPNTPQNTIVFAHAPIKEICIEWNGAVALSDFIPSLQTELQRHGVASRVYDAGTQPGNCPVTLAYNAAVKWDTKMFSDEYSPYLTFASITLRKDGRVLGSGQYRSDNVTQDKWSSTTSKLGPVVDSLLISNPVTEGSARASNAAFSGS